MAARVAALVGDRRARAMWVMTFHSACVRILRREAARFGYPSNFSIYDSADSQRLMAMVCRELELDARQYPPKSMAAQVSNLKNELIDYESFAANARGAREKALAEAYAEYQRRLVAAGAMDFDDLIMVTVNLFQAFPEVSEAYRRRFRHVLVDEYQDTNHAQYTLVRELVSGGGPLFSKSSPASVRTNSADPLAPTDSPEPAGRRPSCASSATRTSPSTRSAARRSGTSSSSSRTTRTRRSSCLSRTTARRRTSSPRRTRSCPATPGRKPKNLWSEAGDGPPITGYVADNEHDEAAFVAEEVDRLNDEGLATPGQVAVFYRTNAQSRVFEEVFIRVGLPYRVVGGVRFYERREVRDLLAYLRLIANPADEVSLRRVLNVPKRGIGDRAEEYVAGYAARERISFARRCGRLPTFPASRHGPRRRSRASTPWSTSCASRRRRAARWPSSSRRSSTETGLQASLENSEDLQDATRVENLQEMVSVAREFDGSQHQHGRAPSPTSLSGSRSSRTPTRSPTARTTAAW